MLEAFELIDWIWAAVGGWKYLFSAAYRAEVRERWRRESALRILWDILCGFAGIAFTLIVVWMLVALFAGWDWLRRLAET